MAATKDMRFFPDGRFRLALAQLDPTVGDVAGNAALVRKARAKAAADGAHLVVFSELVLVGYPPEDLVLRPSLFDAVDRELAALASETAKDGPALLVTAPTRAAGGVQN